MTSRGRNKLSAFAAASRRSEMEESEVITPEPPSKRKKKIPPAALENGSTTLQPSSMTKSKRVKKKRKVREEEDPSFYPQSVSEETELDEVEVAHENIEENYQERNGVTNDDHDTSFSPQFDSDSDEHEMIEDVVPEENIVLDSFCKNGSGNKASEESFRWLLNPITPAAFYKKHFEKGHLHIKRTNENYYKGLFSSEDLNIIMKKNTLSYGDQIDVTTYVDGQRIPASIDTKVYPDFVWNHFKQGYSIRMRNPHTYHKSLWKLCSLLQEYFSSYVGANMYLTPSGAQGFPPHYDDIDAFILQIEGRKVWKLHKPKNKNEVLARHSSGDFTQEELHSYEEIELNAGDLLYFPRGYTHQAKTTYGEHSLHLTLSTNQLNTFGDFLEKGFMQALESAIDNDVEFRQSIPRDYLDYAGSGSVKSKSKERIKFKKTVMRLAHKALNKFSVDEAADVQSLDFIEGSLPPCFNKTELGSSIHGNGAQFENGRAIVMAKLHSKTEVKLIRKRAFRLTVDDTESRLFYTLENSRNHKEKVASFVDIDFEMVPAVAKLFQTYPDFIRVADLPLETTKLKLEFVQQLYDYGFLMTKVASSVDRNSL